MSRAEVRVGLLLGVVTAAVYMIGARRSFGYDAAASFANFIATPSIWDAFAVRSVIPTIPLTQVATNDHVLLSLLSHLIYSATGTRSEAVYRLIPALAAGATVGVSTAALVRRFGMLAGVCAGLRHVALPFTGAQAPLGAGVAGADSPFAVAGSLGRALAAQPDLLLEALALAAVAAAAPYVRSRWHAAGLGALMLVLTVLAVPAAAALPLVVAAWVTSVALGVRAPQGET